MLKYEINTFRIVVGVLVGFVIICLVWLLVRMEHVQSTPEPETQAILHFPQTPFAMTRDAEATFVFDIANQAIIFADNEDDVLPLASITKIMTAIVALEHAEPDMPVKISNEALSQTGDNFLVAGETWRLNELIEFMLITSSNDAAYAIAETVPILGQRGVETFTTTMNGKAYDLGLFTLSFTNPSGLDATETEPSAYGSARDVAALLVYGVLTYPEVFQTSAFQHTTFASLEFPTHTATNTNVVAEHLPALIASKTGYTDNTGGNLAFMFEAGLGRPVVAVILGSTFEGRFVEAEQLTAATIKAIRKAR